jgi:glycine cleavage system H protein
VSLITCDDFYGQSVTIEDRYLYYLPEHLWVDCTGDDIYRFGVSHAGVILVNGFKYMDFAVSVGEQIDVEDSLVFVETFKAMINVTSPISGTVAQINEKLSGEGIKLLDESYHEEYLVGIQSNGLDVATVFLTAEQYLEALLRGDADHCGAGARVMRRNR